MTDNKKFKKTVRERMERTGETYTQARRVLLADTPRLAEEAPQFIEIETPFNPGWYFYDVEYPEEGSVGPFSSEHDARENARLQEYDPDDEDAVRFVEQKNEGAIILRYALDSLRSDARGLEMSAAAPDLAREVRDVLVGRLASVSKEIERGGVRIPAPDGVGVDVTSGRDGIVRARVRVTNPGDYPDFVRELADVGLLDARQVVSRSFRG